MDKINFLMEKTTILNEELNSLLSKHINSEEILKTDIKNLNNTQANLGDHLSKITSSVDNLQIEFIKPNLLINGNFMINQRGKTEYIGSGIYTVDRWKLYGQGSLKVNNNNTITYTIGSTNWVGMIYHIEKPSILSNKTFTISAKGSSTAGIWIDIYKNGSSLAYTYTTNTGDFYLTKTIAFGEILDTDNVFIKITTQNTNMPEGIENNSFTLEYVKLETGTYATPNISKNYAEELMLCQRYYQIHYKYKVANHGYGYYEPNISLHTPMRIQPTKKMYAANGYGEISSNENTVFDISKQTELNITKAVFGYGNQYSFVVSNGNGTFTKDHDYRFVIFCDAEIY